MATYQQYPTPPPTSSPKHSMNYQSQPQAYGYDYPEPSSFTQSQPLPRIQPKPPAKVPAQDSYFHSFSAPTSPDHTNPSSQRPPNPFRRRSSPLIGPGGVQYSQASPSPHRPRPYSPSSLNRLSPRPLHYSPINPVPSPYSAGRPKPRPGFLRRIAAKLEAWIKGFISWGRRNPITAGILTFIPVMTVAGVVKIARGLGKGLGLIGNKFGKSLNTGEVAGDKGIGGEGEWGWGLDDFKGFGGSKGGPLEGLLKVLQMLVNHWCKLTPSPYPRAASLLMELYFLDAKKL